MKIQSDITYLMLRFREAVRHSWNTYFFDADDVMGPDISAAFWHVEQGLFQGVVLCACNNTQTDASYGSELASILVKPRPERLGHVLLQIGEPSKTGGMVWESPVEFKIDQHSRMNFIRFYDLHNYEQISLSLVEVKIVKLNERHDLDGLRALVAADDVSFFISE